WRRHPPHNQIEHTFDHKGVCATPTSVNPTRPHQVHIRPGKICFCEQVTDSIFDIFPAGLGAAFRVLAVLALGLYLGFLGLDELLAATIFEILRAIVIAVPQSK
ncbi:hypothetical protein MXD62_14050, partial [Frankia sp. Mgl5]|uniref:hypothetical protein n=1 Tax=Frankia sp. Mgl5 TaxID=2933793 RepID=UPI00200EA8EB